MAVIVGPTISLPKVFAATTILKIHSAIFVQGAVSLETCPVTKLPEFAFIGRSNVGKSALLNLLSNQSALARVSGKPGRTREINFFTINKDWSMVDLPGYGYAKASLADRDRFHEFVSEYLLERSNLSCAFVLIDSRHSPQKIDLEFVRWLLESNVPFNLVFTKADKVKPGEVKKNIALFTEAMAEWSEGVPNIFTSSVKTGEGRREILRFIGEALRAS